MSDLDSAKQLYTELNLDDAATYRISRSQD